MAREMSEFGAVVVGWDCLGSHRKTRAPGPLTAGAAPPRSLLFVQTDRMTPLRRTAEAHKKAFANLPLLNITLITCGNGGRNN
ncbi:unnamed protein product [Caenorhabditis auriculariae]|uniref:Uncharacterized protein n=1 Tax=Caenorhabditis auriculariae TaxID=2777116 RepID=A0A8S1GLW5_9PELO|nr:unnamed protein product [Caenorhabditis auriculariae]